MKRPSPTRSLRRMRGDAISRLSAGRLDEMDVPATPAAASPSPDAIARLAFVRYVHTVGIEQSKQPEPMAALAVLSFHDCADLFLQLAAEHAEASGLGQHVPLLRYFEPINAALGPGRHLQHEPGMRRLNTARNNLKHHSLGTTRRDVEQLRVTVAAFLQDNTRLVFGLDYDAISMVDLVACEPARVSLKEAETHLAKGEPEQAQSAVAVAFAQLIHDYERRATSRYGRSPFAFGESLAWEASFHHGGPAFSQPGKIINSIVALQEGMKILGLGIDYRRYTKFRLLTPSVRRMGNDQYNVQIIASHPSRPAWPPALDACRFCFDFVIESAIRLQDFELDAFDVDEHETDAAGAPAR